MERKIFIQDEILSLAEYMPEDDYMDYNDWLDPDTQKGYNYKFDESFEEFSKSEIKNRFYSSITLNKGSILIGNISISPQNSLPDLAIRIYKPYRKQGYGTRAFALGVKYAFENFKFDELYAGCYSDNESSFKMLKKCGFLPHTEGNLKEKHFLTGDDIIQFDFVYRKEFSNGF